MSGFAVACHDVSDTQLAAIRQVLADNPGATLSSTVGSDGRRQFTLDGPAAPLWEARKAELERHASATFFRSRLDIATDLLEGRLWLDDLMPEPAPLAAWWAD